MKRALMSTLVIFVLCFAGMTSGIALAAETIDFEGMPAGTIVSTVYGDGGGGPIAVVGTNPGLPPGTNAAIIFDSSNPPGIDYDLGTPNEDFGGPGIGAGGESGSPYQNDTFLGNLIIVAEDLVDGNSDGLVDVPNDADLVGSAIYFDFTAVAPVTIFEMDIIDVEAEETPAQVHFYDASLLLIATYTLPQAGDNGVAKAFSLGPTSGVSYMDVVLNGSGAIDNIVFEEEPPDSDGYYIDIKPTSCPNPLNPRSGGVLPVAILGTAYFDVMDVDPSTILLEGVAPLRWAIEDVTTPFEGELCGCTTEGPDGFDDMTLKFRKRDIVDVLPPFEDGDELVLTLTATLYDGTEFEASDCVIMRARGGGGGKLSTSLPHIHILAQNSPNPFNPSTEIVYGLSDDAHVQLTIYNLMGQEVARLVDDEQLAGYHAVTWHASGLSAGVYFCRFEAGDVVETKTMMLLK